MHLKIGLHLLLIRKEPRFYDQHVFTCHSFELPNLDFKSEKNK